MFHVGVALMALLVPSVHCCTVHVGNLRAAILPKDSLIHVHVVVFGKVFCAPLHGMPRPLKVTLDVGHRLASPSDYQQLSNKTFGTETSIEFALSGAYSYSAIVECTPGQPRVTVEDFCGKKVLDDLKPTYERELGSKNQLLKVYDLGRISPGPFAGSYDH